MPKAPDPTECKHGVAGSAECESCDAEADARDGKNSLAIAGDVLKQTDKGRAALEAQGLGYLSEDEREFLYGIVYTVERVLICEANAVK